MRKVWRLWGLVWEGAVPGLGNLYNLEWVGDRKKYNQFSLLRSSPWTPYLQDGMRGPRFVRLAEAALARILQTGVPGLCLVWFGLPRLQFNDWPGPAEFLNLTVQRSVFAAVWRLTVQTALSAQTWRSGLPGTSHWWSWAVQPQNAM